MYMDEILKNLECIMGVLDKTGHYGQAKVVQAVIDNSQDGVINPDLLNNNEWWGGAGSIIDCYIDDQLERKKLRSNLVLIARYMVSRNVDNSRMNSWLNFAKEEIKIENANFFMRRIYNYRRKKRNLKALREATEYQKFLESSSKFDHNKKF